MSFVRETDGTYTTTKPVTEDGILAMASELIDRRYQREHSLADPDAAKEYLRRKLAHLPDEHFYVLYLDTQHRLIEAQDAFRGSVRSTFVYPRAIVREALRLNASAVIFGHQHPGSGDPTPSPSDRSLTVDLVDALKLIDVRVLDHIIVGGNTTLSFAERGYL